MKQTRFFAILPFLALSACATPPAEAPIERPVFDDNACDADALFYLVGQNINEVDTDTLPHPYRAISPGMAVTMDYRADRTNFELDENDRIVRVYCG
ncbi:I78 family peptidase inhibitor [Hyphobacterium sp. HN65]|uniref:I78 family peptidase inhibitor n=1 Tax=Hyphobacterium lacteum TaxID=3116575 RepID=A0ABU7LLH8_9PROT|nr:I78 family peptidase inhibitor [Hyphobacterium sp. HN65]MEE2524783.1 I78 family peptidase inhibitor [Hyphobacterium sp. HN65]